MKLEHISHVKCVSHVKCSHKMQKHITCEINFNGKISQNPCKFVKEEAPVQNVCCDNVGFPTLKWGWGNIKEIIAFYL